MHLTKATVKQVAISICLVAALGLPAGSPMAGDPPSSFTEEAVARGLNYAMSSFPQTQGLFGNGLGFVDLDNDGDPDVVIMGSPLGKVGIFENIGGGVFVDRSAGSGIPTLTEQEALGAADYDGDGLIDLYLTQHGQWNVLVRNLGNFTFANVSLSAGIIDNGPAMGVSWGDYDDDGWLDVYVNNYSGFPPYNRNVLYHNNGNGTFTNMAPALGLDSNALSFQSVWSDYDKDGDVDLYISNDRAPLGWPANELWRNDSGIFVDVSESSNANVSLYSMGLAAGDFDGNLYPDYYTTNVFEEPPPFDSHPEEGVNPLLLNLGDGTFVESAIPAGVANYTTSWGAIFFDYDNNGFKDLYVNNMWVPNTFFANDGLYPCTEMAAALGIGASYDPTYVPGSGVPADIVSFASAVADVDGDGDLDLLVNNAGDRAQLFINHEGSKRNHVRYTVVGEYPNRFAVGVSIETTAGGNVYWDESYAGGNGYLGQNELVLHVGLGDTTIVDQAVVHWPSNGPTRTLTELPVNETWTIYPPSRLCDAEGDGDVDNDDFVAFAGCFASGFAAGCEMMDHNGNSSIYADDLDACFVTSPNDCNGNGTEDLLEIMLDLGLDADANGVIDCCAGSTPFPNEVGASLRLAKNGGNVELIWDAPPVDASHDPATSYDVFRATAVSADSIILANVSATTHSDSGSPSPQSYYLVGARNSCGSSGEEPF